MFVTTDTLPNRLMKKYTNSDDYKLYVNKSNGEFKDYTITCKELKHLNTLKSDLHGHIKRSS